MIINLDKFLIKELNKQGIQLTYQEFVVLYRRSRQDPECQRRRKCHERQRELERQWIKKMVEEDDET